MFDFKNIFESPCPNKLTLNTLKTYFMLHGPRQRLAALGNSIALSVHSVSLSQVVSIKCLLGVDIDETMTRKTHIHGMGVKISDNLPALRRVKIIFNQKNLVTLYKAITAPYLLLLYG